jgi:hypothetical protein
MSDLLQYNAFGLVRVEKNKITATITAVSNGKSITRSAREEDINIKDIDANEFFLVTFGAFLQKGKSRITVHEIEPKDEEFKIVELVPQVGKIIEKVVDMAKKGAGVE